MKDIKAIIEGIVSQGKPVGSGAYSFRHSSSSKAKGWDHGIDVGAHRNHEHEVRAMNTALGNAKKREQEVKKRNKEAEQRQKETAKMAKEEIVTEAKHVFHVHMKSIDDRMHKMVDDNTSEPIGNKPKGHKLVLKVPAADSREARNKVSKHISRNYGIHAVKSIEYKGLDEETVTEAKKFVYDKPHPALVKAYDKRDTADLHGMHKRWSSDHSSPKNNPETSEKLLAVHHVLKSRGENVGDLPKHKNLGMTVHEETNTEKREKVKSVARMNDPDPTSEKSTLNKTGQIMTKIIEDKPTMSMPNFGLPASLIAATRQILEKKDDDAGDAKKMTGGKTQVELNPETNDKIDEDGKKHTVPKTPKEKKLAALASPKDKITHKDVLVGRGVVKEEEEQLDELKKSTLASYTKKAASDLRANSIAAGASSAMGSTGPKFDKMYKKVWNRTAGIQKAADKLAKEDVEFSDEELARLDAIAAQLDEAKPTIVSAPIRGANQDQNGIGTKSSSADYTISDSKKIKK